MFTEFMGAISDAYDSVDGFFDDLLGEKDLFDVVLDAGKDLLSGSNSSSSKLVGNSTSPMVDFDDSSGDSETLDFLKKQSTASQAIESADAKDIERQWIERLRAISKGQVYGE